MKFLQKLFQNRDNWTLDRCLESFAQGYALCEACKATIPVAGHVPGALEPCPVCQALFFVPMTLEGWVVCRPLGSGGEGGVYLAALPQNPERRAAVKILHHDRDQDASAVAMFLREAEIGASFGNHPRLMQVYAYGNMENGAYMISQLEEGVTLHELLSSRPQGLPPEECLYYTIDLVEALEHIYDAGFIYRDMNLRNVIILHDGFASLIDYGLCMTHEEAWENRDGKVFGTPLFIPPERCLKQGEDYRSDIYSLGMVVFCMVTGHPYFSPTELEQVIKGHLRSLRVPTSAKMPHTDPELVNLTDKMIRRDRDERYQSYDEIREAIYPILGRYRQFRTDNAHIKMRRKRFHEAYGDVAGA